MNNLKKIFSWTLDVLFYGAMLFLVVAGSYLHGLMGFFMAIGYLTTMIAVITLVMTIVTWMVGGKVAVKEMWSVE